MTLIKHELKCNMKSILIWSLVVGGMLLVFMLMFPSMKDQIAQMSSVYANMGSFSDAFGMDKLNLGTAIGFYGVEAGAVIALGGAMFAAIIGISLLAKEEGNHTTEFLFVAPLSRKHILLEKLFSMVVIIVAFDVICYLLAICGFVAVNEVPWKLVTLFHLSQFLMHLEIGCICFGVSAFLHKNNIGLGIGVATLLYFVNMFANITDNVK